MPHLVVHTVKAKDLRKGDISGDSVVENVENKTKFSYIKFDTDENEVRVAMETEYQIGRMEPTTEEAAQAEREFKLRQIDMGRARSKARLVEARAKMQKELDYDFPNPDTFAHMSWVEAAAMERIWLMFDKVLETSEKGPIEVVDEVQQSLSKSLLTSLWSSGSTSEIQNAHKKIEHGVQARWIESATIWYSW